MKGWWKAYAAMLLSRANTVTGVRYRDEPAILAWEIGNEYRCHTCGQGATLHAALAELAAALRALGPSQLIADGGEGMDDQPSLWSLSNKYPVNGSEGASYSTLGQIPELDMMSYHVYPSAWGLDPATDGPVWLATHQALAAQAGKVGYAGEYGYAAADGPRAQMLDAWSRQLFSESGGPLGILWQLLPTGVANNDGFGVYYPADTATVDVLERWAAAVQATSGL
jgi:mannan endo-1,4-beta-mannosidase